MRHTAEVWVIDTMKKSMAAKECAVSVVWRIAHIAISMYIFSILIRWSLSMWLFVKLQCTQMQNATKIKQRSIFYSGSFSLSKSWRNLNIKIQHFTFYTFVRSLGMFFPSNYYAFEMHINCGILTSTKWVIVLWLFILARVSEEWCRSGEEWMCLGKTR